MKITSQQLRNIIQGEVDQLDELFTPAGGIGFAEVPNRRGRSYFQDNPPLSHASSDYTRLRKAMREDDKPDKGLNVTADQLKKLIETEFEKLMLREAPPPFFDETLVSEPEPGQFRHKTRVRPDPAKGEVGEEEWIEGEIKMVGGKPRPKIDVPEEGLPYGYGQEGGPGSSRSLVIQMAAQIAPAVAGQLEALGADFSAPVGRGGKSKGRLIGDALKALYNANPDSLEVASVIELLSGMKLGIDIDTSFVASKEG